MYIHNLQFDWKIIVILIESRVKIAKWTYTSYLYTIIFYFQRYAIHKLAIATTHRSSRRKISIEESSSSLHKIVHFHSINQYLHVHSRYSIKNICLTWAQTNASNVAMKSGSRIFFFLIFLSDGRYLRCNPYDHHCLVHKWC